MKRVFIFWSQTINNFDIKSPKSEYFALLIGVGRGTSLYDRISIYPLSVTNWLKACHFSTIEMMYWFKQLGLSFIVPFLNIPIGGGSSILYEGNNNFGTSTSAFGTSTSSLLGINSGTIIIAIVVGMAAVFLIPLFIYSFTGINTSPYGRSK